MNSKASNKNINLNHSNLKNNQKINPDELEKESNKSVNLFSLENRMINKGRQHSIYERSLKNIKKKETKIAKQVGIKEQKIMKELRQLPKIDKKSKYLVIKKGEYIPIESRAAQIHSQHLTQIILNEESKRMKKIKKMKLKIIKIMELR